MLDIRKRADEVHRWVTECLDKALQLSNKDMSATQEKDEALEGRSTNVDMGKDNESQQPGELSETWENRKFERNPKAFFQAYLLKYLGVSERTVSRNPSDHLDPTPVEPVSGRHAVTVTEMVFSENPNSEIIAMCTTSENRVWIKYKSDGKEELMGLFSKDGSKENETGVLPGVSIVTVQTNITIGIGEGSSRHWVNPNGDKGIIKGQKYTLTRFAKCGDNSLFANAALKNGQRVLLNITFESQSKPAEIRKYGNEITTNGPGFILDASKDTEYIAILLSKKSGPSTLALYSKSESEAEWTLHSTYSPGDQKKILDACFFPVDGKDGKEMLVVVVEGDNKVHVVDHTKGGSFKRYLCTRNVELNRPCRLATDHENVMWIGCEGGKAVLLEL